MSQYVKWKEDQIHGKGTFSYASGGVYDGEYKEGQKHGKGTYTWKDGTKFVGEWFRGKRVSGKFLNAAGADRPQ